MTFIQMEVILSSKRLAQGISPHLGMIADTLDVQRKPVLGTCSLLNCQIAKWFRPWTPGDFSIPNYTNPAATTCAKSDNHCKLRYAFKNMSSKTRSLFTYQAGTSGTYQYSNANFFPLDGKGFGAEIIQGF